ncbi:MAG: class I SAM-dependent methyltransferase [Alphaproteobacteria bacterium]|nr:class I SAM-dependent methyltransferase [Alphaproteobacteria bacterium]
MRPFVQYYDAIYSDKDYHADAEILRGLVKHASRPNILEIGSGTGNQSLQLCKWADVTAVETDADFADVMQKKCATQSAIKLFQGDIGKLAAHGFDAAAAYFHVVNYIHDADALAHLFRETAKRLKSNAPFLFDMWHAECVLADPPRDTTRSKDFDNYLGSGMVVQTILPQLDVTSRKVTLNYKIVLQGITGVAPFTETIRLHLWQQNEIVGVLQRAGFTDVTFYDGRSYPQAATPQSWALWVTARKQ